MTQQSKEIEDKLTTLIDSLDNYLIKFAFNAKLNGLGNAWIYQQLKQKIQEQLPIYQPYLLQWLDSRWGDFKLY